MTDMCDDGKTVTSLEFQALLAVGLVALRPCFIARSSMARIKRRVTTLERSPLRMHGDNNNGVGANMA